MLHAHEVQVACRICLWCLGESRLEFSYIRVELGYVEFVLMGSSSLLPPIGSF